MRYTHENCLGLRYYTGDNQTIKSLLHWQITQAIKESTDFTEQQTLTTWNEHVVHCNKFPVFVFSPKAQEMYQQIELNERNIQERFTTISIKPVTYCLTQNSFAQFFVENNDLQGIFIKYHPNEKTYDFEMIALKLCPEEISHVLQEGSTLVNQLLRAIIFVKLTAPKIVFIASGKSTGNQLNKISNLSKQGFTLVDKAWNQTLQSLSTIQVRGHQRRVWVGKGRTEMREVTVSPFARKGFTRLAKSIAHR